MRYARSNPYSSPTVRPTRLFFILAGIADHNAPIKNIKFHTRAHYVGAAALALHGIHDSVSISGMKIVIICVMLGASPTAPRQYVRLEYFSFYRLEEITTHLLKYKISS